ncbi:MAG: hypothetical protein KF900_14775 [Bacteroidetes bacterium]|nr:hypothetical protein [Bacteroidota bacterium]
MYLLIADSGATKTDWVLLQGSNVILNVKTMGLSPNYQSKEEIVAELQNVLKPQLASVLKDIDEIYFYGTGCSTVENCKKIEDCIFETLQVKKINVTHDLLAAARALCGNEWGIAAILGTGSNSCLYNGTEILENVFSGGYMWGDYGGGSQIGKFFIRDYFEDTMPQDLRKAFEAAGYSHETILNNVYKKSAPSKYMASVSVFAQQHIENPFVQKILTECFDSFFIHQVNKYSNSKKYPVHTVGSVGVYFKDFIAKIAKKHGYQMGKVIQSPMEGLIRFHAQIE